VIWVFSKDISLLGYTAQETVYGFFDCGKEPIPVYVGAHNPVAMMKAAKAISE